MGEIKEINKIVPAFYGLQTSTTSCVLQPQKQNMDVWIKDCNKNALLLAE